MSCSLDTFLLCGFRAFKGDLIHFGVNSFPARELLLFLCKINPFWAEIAAQMRFEARTCAIFAQKNKSLSTELATPHPAAFIRGGGWTPLHLPRFRRSARHSIGSCPATLPEQHVVLYGDASGTARGPARRRFWNSIGSCPATLPEQHVVLPGDASGTA